jgi:hypothetical protein
VEVKAEGGGEQLHGCGGEAATGVAADGLAFREDGLRWVQLSALAWCQPGARC